MEINGLAPSGQAFSVAQVAQYFGVTPGYLRALARKHLTKRAGHWRFSAQEVNRLALHVKRHLRRSAQ